MLCVIAWRPAAAKHGCNPWRGKRVGWGIAIGALIGVPAAALPFIKAPLQSCYAPDCSDGGAVKLVGSSVAFKNTAFYQNKVRLALVWGGGIIRSLAAVTVPSLMPGWRAGVPCAVAAKAWHHQLASGVCVRAGAAPTSAPAARLLTPAPTLPAAPWSCCHPAPHAHTQRRPPTAAPWRWAR
jgi:hypothetical protein